MKSLSTALLTMAQALSLPEEVAWTFMQQWACIINDLYQELVGLGGSHLMPYGMVNVHQTAQEGYHAYEALMLYGGYSRHPYHVENARRYRAYCAALPPFPTGDD
jgi:hypothetical protein